jgi:hypothetical protein
MGIGGTLATGCNIGNALTGLSVLAVNSVIATAGIFVGVALAIGVGALLGSKRATVLASTDERVGHGSP